MNHRPDTPEMCHRFVSLGTAMVSDVLDEAGFHSQTIAPSLGFVGAPRAFCGPALCVRGERTVTTRTARAEAAGLPLYNLPTLARSGAVLVLSTSGFGGGAVTGELLAIDLMEAGVAGLLTDGLIRDRETLAALDLPVMAAGAIPTNGARRFQIAEWGAPVHMPGPEGSGVTVRPGDLVLADGDGAVVIPADAASDVLAMSEELDRKEAALKREAPTLSPEARARARAERMSHMTWLRNAETRR